MIGEPKSGEQSGGEPMSGEPSGAQPSSEAGGDGAPSAETFTLKGFLERFRNGRNHAQETYKLYAEERAILARVRRLPPPLAALVEKAIVEFGGVVPRSLYEKLAFEDPWDASTWRAALEACFLGTVREVALGRLRIHANEETLILFHEVVLARLRALAAERPAPVATEVVMGVDLVSDLVRFLAFLGEDHVRFTVHGELFKASERRLVDQFVPGLDPRSREPSSQEVLDFIYRFALAEGLIDRTGERTFTVSEKGRAWESRPLAAKQQDCLRFALDERGLPGEPLHQAGLRRSLIRFLKRCEPERWYDAMFLPFVARNAYLASLEHVPLEAFVALRPPHAAPAEDLQQMGWNLLVWVRRRLTLLGIVDLGLDEAGRPVAMRLSRLGAKLLGVLSSRSLEAGRSHLVVNPNFEVVLLPEGEEFDIVHALDRFCVRRQHEVLYHYELTEESVRRGLRDGLSLSEIVGWLARHARAPLPQNVLFSIREWGARAGVLTLEGERLTTDRADVIERLAGEPRMRRFIAERPSPQSLLLRPGASRSELARTLRELGLDLDRP
jgi:XPB/Ssl2-like helicase family protein